MARDTNVPTRIKYYNTYNWRKKHNDRKNKNRNQ